MAGKHRAEDRDQSRTKPISPSEAEVRRRIEQLRNEAQGSASNG